MLEDCLALVTYERLRDVAIRIVRRETPEIDRLRWRL